MGVKGWSVRWVSKGGVSKSVNIETSFSRLGGWFID